MSATPPSPPVIPIIDARRIKKVAPKKQKNVACSLLTFDVLYPYGLALEHGRIVYVHPQWSGFLGYRQEELIGKTAVMVVAPECLGEVQRHIRKRMTEPYELVVVTKAGTRVTIETSAEYAFWGDPPREVRLVKVRRIGAMQIDVAG